MITRDVAEFVSLASTLAPDFGPPTARGAFLVAPDGFVRTAQSAEDNLYMAGEDAYDAALASAQHRALHRALSAVLPTVCFAGDPAAPDALFPNNVFATRPGTYVVGRMHHPVRQLEATRADIRHFFRDIVGYDEVDLSVQEHPCELTGSLVVDRSRGIGFVGLSDRCDEVGARLMHEALGLRATLMFDLSPGEYHTNVVLAIHAGRAAMFSRPAFASDGVTDALTSLYGEYAIELSPEEHAAFAANSIALSGDVVWMSAGAERSLTPATRDALTRAGFRVEAVELGGIEVAGGSLRCCVGEIF